MRYLILICVLGLAIVCDLGVYVATSADAFESFDPLHPATLLPIVLGRLQALRARVGDLVNDLVEEFAAPYRERIRHEYPTPAPVP